MYKIYLNQLNRQGFGGLVDKNGVEVLFSQRGGWKCFFNKIATKSQSRDFGFFNWQPRACSYSEGETF